MIRPSGPRLPRSSPGYRTSSSMVAAALRRVQARPICRRLTRGHKSDHRFFHDLRNLKRSKGSGQPKFNVSKTPPTAVVIDPFERCIWLAMSEPKREPFTTIWANPEYTYPHWLIQDRMTITA